MKQRKRRVRGYINDRRSDGKVLVRVFLGLGEKEVLNKKGEMVRPKLYRMQVVATKTEAKDLLDQWLPQKRTLPKNSKIKVGKHLEEWLKDYAASRVAPKTLDNYTREINCHLIPHLGRIPLQELRVKDVEKFMADQDQRGRARASINHNRMILRQALDGAVRDELISRNPAALAKPLKVEHQEKVIWDEEQVRLFIAEARRSSSYPLLYETALATGLREGELLGARWSDLDLSSGALQVRQSVQRLGVKGPNGERKVQIIWRPLKTAASRRIVVLPPYLLDGLKRLKDQQAQAQAQVRSILNGQWVDLGEHGPLIFAQRDGKPLHAHNIVRRDFHELIRRAKLPQITFHRLRHIARSLAERAQAPRAAVRDRFGWSSDRMSDHYLHALPGDQDAFAQAMERMLNGNGRVAAG